MSVLKSNTPAPLGRRARPTREEDVLLRVLEADGRSTGRDVDEIDAWALRASAKAISHDLREPMLAVQRLCLWIAELLPEDATEEAKQYQTLLEGRLHRLGVRYDALRRFIEAGMVLDAAPPTAVSIVDLYNDVVVDVAGKSTREVRSDALGDPIAMNVLTSGAALSRCLSELVQNAVVHHDGDLVHIRLRVKKLNGARRIDMIDDGPGMPREFHERAFEPFSTWAPDPTEAGMGLAIVRRIAALRRGWVEVVDHDHGRGTHIRLIWPEG